MASTFTLNSTSYDGRYLQVALTQTKDAANRRSKITGTVTTMAGNSGWYATGATTVTVAGTQRYTRARESNGNGQSQRGFVGNITEFYVSHDTAGNASVSVEISTAIYYSAQKATSGTWTLDSIGASTTSCGAPTACSVNSTLAEGNVTLSWSGAKSGTNNTISSYEIQYSESSNNSDWGSWTALTTVTTTATVRLRLLHHQQEDIFAVLGFALEVRRVQVIIRDGKHQQTPSAKIQLRLRRLRSRQARQPTVTKP